MKTKIARHLSPAAIAIALFLAIALLTRGAPLQSSTLITAAPITPQGIRPRQRRQAPTGKGPKKKGNQSMKNGDTIATVIAFFLVLPWLARLIVSAKAIWRALTEGSSMKKAKRTNQTHAAIYPRY